MKRFLSWVVLIACTSVVSFVQTIAYKIALCFFQWYLNVSIFLRIMLVLFGGGIALGLIFAPIVYGAALSVIASYAVSPSPKGLRYIIWGTIYLLLCLTLAVVSYTFENSFDICAIASALYAIGLIISGSKHTKLA